MAKKATNFCLCNLNETFGAVVFSSGGQAIDDISRNSSTMKFSCGLLSNFYGEPENSNCR